MFSALPLRADIAQCGRHVRFVPISEVIKLIRTPAGYDGVSHPINPQACELVHNHLRSSGTEYGCRRDQAMTQQSAKRIRRASGYRDRDLDCSLATNLNRPATTQRESLVRLISRVVSGTLPRASESARGNSRWRKTCYPLQKAAATNKNGLAYWVLQRPALRSISSRCSAPLRSEASCSRNPSGSTSELSSPGLRAGNL